MGLTDDASTRCSVEAVPSRELSSDELARLLEQTLERMAGVNRLLADQ